MPGVINNSLLSQKFLFCFIFIFLAVQLIKNRAVDSRVIKFMISCPEWVMNINNGKICLNISVKTASKTKVSLLNVYVCRNLTTIPS